MVVGGRELIDTLWNVNMLLKIFLMMLFFELIDTLWNVNNLTSMRIGYEPGINRYIMECKSRLRSVTV